MTAAEKLWKRLKKQIRNKRFLRQFSVGQYVIDAQPELKPAIEGW
jgi:very-short-patch-repair endonuclease